MEDDELTEVQLIGGSRVEPPRDGPRRSSSVVTAALLVALVAAGLVTVSVLVGQSGSDEDASAPDDAPLDEDEGDEGDQGEEDDGPGEAEAPHLGGDQPDATEFGEYGRPLVVSPDSGLVDQQLVTVAGDEFPANTTIGVVVCSSALLDDQGSGADHCDPAVLGTMNTSGTGSFDTEVQVPRVAHLGTGGWIDCASAPPDGRTTTCVLAAGPRWDSGLGGLADVRFDPALDPIEAPALVVEQATGLIDGQEIVVRVTNTSSFEMVEAGLCTRDDMDHGVCHWFPEHDWSLVEVDGASTWELRSPVPRWLSTPDDRLFDCAEEDVSCSLSAAAGRWPLDPVVLEFEPIDQ